MKNLDENEVRRRKKERELTELEPGTPAFVRCGRAIQLCDEAADIMFRIERQSDVIERRYNKLIEQKTVFAGRAGGTDPLISCRRERTARTGRLFLSVF